MSIRAMVWAFDQQGLDCGIKFTLVALADKADDQHSCYPGQAMLARMTGQDARTIRRHVAQLAELGLLTRQHRYRPDRRGRTSDRYVLAVDGPLPVTVSASTDPLLPGDVSGNTEDVLPDTGDVLPDTGARSTGHHARGTVREPLVEPPVGPPGGGDGGNVKPIRRRDALFDALVEAFNLDPDQMTRGAKSGIGKVAAELKAVDATPDEIRLRAKRYVHAHPGWEASPHALAKHWADPDIRDGPDGDAIVPFWEA